MINSTLHLQRLETFYLRKGLAEDSAKVFALQKIEKIADDASDLSYIRWLSDLIDSFAVQLGRRKSDLVVVDFGCGSGELVMVLRSLGVAAYGYDIYEEEIALGKELAKDNGVLEDIMFSDHELLCSRLPNLRIDILLSFSVLEHLDDRAIADMFDKFQHRVTGLMYHLVPNKYKITDDHTGLRFLGLLPHTVSRAIVGARGRAYLLSESLEWDVWYRSLTDFGRIARDRGLSLELVEESRMYPPLASVPVIGAPQPGRLKSIVLKVYAILILIITRSSKNLYPYLNIVLKAHS